MWTLLHTANTLFSYMSVLAFHNHKLPDITLKMTTIKNYCVVRILFYRFSWKTKCTCLTSNYIVIMTGNDKMLQHCWIRINVLHWEWHELRLHVKKTNKFETHFYICVSQTCILLYWTELCMTILAKYAMFGGKNVFLVYLSFNS